jgi:hypothetical protein
VPVFIEYKLSDRRWLINLSTTDVSEKKRFKGFFEKAMCPKEAQEAIMLKFDEDVNPASGR